MYNANYFQQPQQQQNDQQQLDQYHQYSNNSNFNSNQQQQQQLQSDQLSSPSNGQIPQLWMGELDQRWDEATIRHIWASLLTNLGILIYSVKLIKDKQSYQMGLNNAGYCFIRFKNFEDASKVLNEFNGKPIPGTNNQFYFRLNWSSANIQAAATAAAINNKAPLIQGSPNQSIEYSIFVGDLPQNINEQILLQTFKSRYPSCNGVKIMIDQSTGNIKGYGFVKFLNEDDQRRSLIEMQGFILLGRPIRVSTAAKSNNSNNNGTVNGNTYNNNNNNNLLNSSFSNIQNSNSPSPNLKPTSQGQSSTASLQYFNDPANTTVFIGGLNVSLTENQLLELFSKFGDITYVKIPHGKNCGFVQYFHRSCAELAINEMQGYDIGGGCKIRVSWGARAAQRNWFARQILMQQQPPQFSHHNQQQQQQQQHLQNSSQLDLTTLMQLSQSQEVVNTLGLSGTSLNISDSMLSNNGYSVEQIPFQNEQIPFSSFSSSTTSAVLSDDELKLNSLLLNGGNVGFDLIDKGSNMYNV